MSLTYASTAVERFGDAEIAALLRHSRENNTALGLTGMHLFKGDQFMQVLEGEDEQVKALYTLIEADPRHTNVRTLLNTPITTRKFSEWSMGYQVVSDETLKAIPGYNDFLDPITGRRKTWDDPSKAQWLLDWFRTHSM